MANVITPSGLTHVSVKEDLPEMEKKTIAQVYTSQQVRVFAGFFTIDDFLLIDIDECATNGTCGEHAQCRNTEGSYTCVRVCKPGYQERKDDNCTGKHEREHG